MGSLLWTGPRREVSLSLFRRFQARRVAGQRSHPLSSERHMRNRTIIAVIATFAVVWIVGAVSAETSTVHYTDGVMVISGAAGVAVVQFTKIEGDGGIGYSFRFKPAGDGAEVRGEARTWPHVQPPDPTTRPAADAASPDVGFDYIRAGGITLMWNGAKGNNDNCRVYYSPKELSVQTVFANLNDVDVSHYAR
jgi:hypothetical protein